MLLSAREVGSLSLILRNVENQDMGGTRTVTSSDLGGAGYYIAARTSAPAAAPAAIASAPRSSGGSAAPRRPSGPTMAIVRGVESTTYEVKRNGGY